MDLANFLTNIDVHVEAPNYIPDVLPVSKIDIDRNPPMDLMLPMSDPCDRCGAFNMQVGDYVCFGFCRNCLGDAYKGDY